jgi:hypothetical protein
VIVSLSSLLSEVYRWSSWGVGALMWADMCFAAEVESLENQLNDLTKDKKP